MAFVPMSQIEVIDPSTVTLKGYATITGVPFQYLDPFSGRRRTLQFDQGAFAGWLARNAGAPVDVHWQHGLDNFQIAETTDVHEDERGLAFTARPIASSVGVDALTTMAGRMRTGASLMLHFGDTETRHGVEHIVDVPLVGEIGPAPVGANPLAFTEIVERADENQNPEPAAAPAANSAALAATIYRALAQLRRS